MKLPTSPGIYKMLNKEGEIIYIGKAKDLNKRVRQYFQKNYEHSTRTKKLLENAKKIDFITVDSELEATILESNLIKEHQPKYNVLMKDGKNYVYIKITKEDFPRIQIVRKIEKDNAKYIGPKTAANKVEETFKVLKKIFPFRHCNLDIKFIKKDIKNGKYKVEITKKTIKYPCLDFYIKRCIGPCIGKCDKEEYAEIIKNAENFLKGFSDKILKTLYEKMQTEAKNRDFEKAAKTRDKIKKIEEITEKQKVDNPNQEDKDIINYVILKEKAYFNLFQIRNGKLIGQENFILSAKETEDNTQEKEVLSAFIDQYYPLATDIPKEILLPHEIDTDSKIKSKIIIPQKGTNNKLLEMSLNNAKIYADRHLTAWQEENKENKNANEELKKVLNIEKEIKRIECYDISHLDGTNAVGSMIVFKNGTPQNKLYRKFKLKTTEGKNNDYKSLKEILTRRFSKIIQKKEKLQKIKTKKYSELVTEITDTINKKLDNESIKNQINKIKSKRFYIICKTELKEHYLLTGFEEIKKIPKELSKKYKYYKTKYKDIECLVYDKIKHSEDESFKEIPDLIIIDGGKGQLNVAEKVLKTLHLQIPHISLAKKLEEIFISGKSVPIILKKDNEALKLLQRIRDEAHRFAISYNKTLRNL